MTIFQPAATPSRAPIGRRPGADPASAWLRQMDPSEVSLKVSTYTTRLAIDVTPTLRGRIKVVALRRGITAADMFGELLEHDYPEGVV